MMKKIVLIQSMGYTLAGMTAATVYIADMLISQGYDVDIITRDQTKVTNTLRHYDADHLHEYYSISPHRIPIREMDFASVYGAMRDSYSSEFIAALEAADMVISFNEGLALLPAILKLETPFCQFYHFPSPNAPPDKRVKVLCNSYFTGIYATHYYGVSPTVVYPLPAPGNYISATPEEKDIDLLWVGRFSTDKNVELLNKLVKRVAVPLVAVGSTWWENFRPKKLDERLTLIENAKIEDLQELYSRAKIVLSTKGYGVDVLSAPNLCEHFGITLLEGAYSRALPLVHRSGGPYFDFLAGKEGYYGYSYVNLAGLVDGIKNILDSWLTPDCEKIRRNAFQKAIKMYDHAYVALAGVVNEEDYS